MFYPPAWYRLTVCLIAEWSSSWKVGVVGRTGRGFKPPTYTSLYFSPFLSDKSNEKNLRVKEANNALLSKASNG